MHLPFSKVADTSFHIQGDELRKPSASHLYLSLKLFHVHMFSMLFCDYALAAIGNHLFETGCDLWIIGDIHLTP